MILPKKIAKISLHFHEGNRMIKEEPWKLSQKIRHLRTSRDELKINNREKTQQNKKLRDRNVEIIESRDRWKARHEELHHQNEDLEQQIQVAKEEIERERIRADEERKRADTLQAEIDFILKKKSRA